MVEELRVEIIEKVEKDMSTTIHSRPLDVLRSRSTLTDPAGILNARATTQTSNLTSTSTCVSSSGALTPNSASPKTNSHSAASTTTTPGTGRL